MLTGKIGATCGLGRARWKWEMQAILRFKQPRGILWLGPDSFKQDQPIGKLQTALQVACRTHLAERVWP